MSVAERPKIPLDPPEASTLTLKAHTKHAWNGFKLVSTKLENFLSINFLGTIIDAANILVDNPSEPTTDTLRVLYSLGKRLEIISQDLPRQRSELNPTCQRFSRALEQARVELESLGNDEIPIFLRLGEATNIFELELALATTWFINRIQEDAKLVRLSHLRPSQDATFQEVQHVPCMQGTRQDILQEIMDWCNNSTPVYCLTGMAGRGKSTIAYTVCKQLCDENDAARRLGASFFCSRQAGTGRSRRNIIPTIAYNLALRIPAFAQALLDAQLDAQLPAVEDHIRSLLIEPWIASTVNSASKFPPLVVVVDALDLLGDDARVFIGELITELRQHKDTLRGLKFLITSRRDHEIEQVYSSAGNDIILRYQLDDVKPNIVEEDIKKYFRASLPAHLKENQLNVLARQASGLFIYAATIVRFVMSPHKSHRQNSRLTTVLEEFPGKSHRDGNGLLIDHLYEDILRDWMFEMSEVEQIAPCAILRIIVGTEEPIQISDIPQLNDFALNFVEETVQSLHAVLLVSEVTRRVESYHKSFVEFMLDVTRFTDRSLGEKVVVRPAHQVGFTIRCFRIMDSLRFNICELKSSFEDDPTGKDGETLVEAKIPSSLAYACRHWADHMSKIPSSSQESVKGVYLEWLKSRWLFWIEAMNLLKRPKECYHLLAIARKTIELNIEPETTIDLRAAEDLARLFSNNTPSSSTPHLYISVLPLSRPESNLIASWQRRFPGTPRIIAATLVPVANPYLSLPHEDYVYSVAFSPDGKHIVSGTGDKLVYIWDASTGDIVRQLRGHGADVYSVCYSPDGHHIASASKDHTVRIWEASTGRQLHQLDGHTGSVRSVCFSQDGKFVASGSDDQTVLIWKVANGQKELDLGGCGKVNSVSFSPDGHHVAAASADMTVRIWDVNSKEDIHSHGKHDGHVSSVCFSPDGKYVVSGSQDRTVRLWDWASGEQSELGTHTGHVLSVSFSQTGSHVASGSCDETGSIWDAAKKQIQHQLHGHVDWVCSVAFSLDGNHVISGSLDRTVRIWNVSTGEQIVRPGTDRSEAVKTDSQQPTYDFWMSSMDSKPLRGTYRLSSPSPGAIEQSQAVIQHHHSGSTQPLNSMVLQASDTNTMRVAESLRSAWDESSQKSINQDWWYRKEYGWVIGKGDTRYMWIPPEMQEVTHSRNRQVYDFKGFARIDLSTGYYGTDWVRCFNPDVTV